MPKCPYCHEEVVLLYSSLRQDLVYDSGKWIMKAISGDTNTVCSNCYEELGPRDLERLSVPKVFRENGTTNN
jgi:hypothetical protein